MCQYVVDNQMSVKLKRMTSPSVKFDCDFLFPLQGKFIVKPFVRGVMNDHLTLKIAFVKNKMQS